MKKYFVSQIINYHQNLAASSFPNLLLEPTGWHCPKGNPVAKRCVALINLKTISGYTIGIRFWNSELMDRLLIRDNWIINYLQKARSAFGAPAELLRDVCSVRAEGRRIYREFTFHKAINSDRNTFVVSVIAEDVNSTRLPRIEWSRKENPWRIVWMGCSFHETETRMKSLLSLIGS